MTKVLYAAYGSNLHPARISARLKSPTLAGVGYVSDRGFRFHKKSKDGSGKGSLIEVGEGVYVAVYELDGPDKAKLDKIEGLGAGYLEDKLNVPGFGDCVTYVAEESAINDDLLPYTWYRQLVVLGCTYHRFPNEYVKLLSAYAATTDQNIERNALNMKLIESIKNGK